MAEQVNSKTMDVINDDKKDFEFYIPPNNNNSVIRQNLHRLNPISDNVDVRTSHRDRFLNRNVSTPTFRNRDAEVLSIPQLLVSPHGNIYHNLVITNNASSINDFLSRYHNLNNGNDVFNGIGIINNMIFRGLPGLNIDAMSSVNNAVSNNNNGGNGRGRERGNIAQNSNPN